MELLREQYLGELGNVRRMEARLKEKVQRVGVLEKEVEGLVGGRVGEGKEREMGRLRKQVEGLE